MPARRPAALVVLVSVFAVSAVEPRSPRPPEPVQPGPRMAPTPGWVKDRLADVDKKINAEIHDLVGLYQHIHANPELSLMEVNTAKRLADEVRKAGYEVTEKVGGTGVVAVLKNGPGPVVLVRTDMDGLPIIEQTGLPYASQVKVKNRDGAEVGVMHACGHDIHMASWVGTVFIPRME